MFQTTSLLILNATLQTLYMVALSGIIAAIVGIPLGVILYVTRKDNILPHPKLHHVLATLVNITRSIPFIILMVSIIPFTRFVVGTSIGTNAAIVPLSISAMPFIARIVENAILEVQKGLIEAATAMGANSLQIITKVLIPEALPGIINGLTLTLIALIGYSAMAGAIGGGGLGDLAIRYGYQRFDYQIMLITIAIMIILVQLVQMLGDHLSKWYARGR
ncbi:MAG TPA: methionine ABC transporter permease [Gammaproteobacteria bacterium]|nr:methionine ABC transporter permease [Gammaproteobacteria bacterium]